MMLLKKPYYLIEFIGYYIIQIIKSNLIIAYDILSPQININPGFISYKTNIKSDIGLLLLSNLISMTPGSLTVNINENKKDLTIHLLYKDEEEKAIKIIKQIEKKIISLTK